MAGYFVEAETGVCLDSEQSEDRLHVKVTDPGTGTHVDVCMPTSSDGLFAMIGIADELPRAVVAVVEQVDHGE